MDWAKFWPTLIPLAGVLIDSFSGVIGSYLSAHPTMALVVVTIVTALANIVRSPGSASK